MNSGQRPLSANVQEDSGTIAVQIRGEPSHGQSAFPPSFPCLSPCGGRDGAQGARATAGTGTLRRAPIRTRAERLGQDRSMAGGTGYEAAAVPAPRSKSLK